jgi:hypothetical protein
MPKITKALKLALILLPMTFLIAGVLWYPYRSGDVPEWKIQIVDTDGHPVAGIRANQEWLDPIEDGKTMVDTQQANAQGFVVFPRRPLHNRLAFGAPQYQPSAHVYICGEGQYGQAFWDAKDHGMVTKLELKIGACPFG